MMYTYTHEKDIEPRLEGLFPKSLLDHILGTIVELLLQTIISFKQPILIKSLIILAEVTIGRTVRAIPLLNIMHTKADVLNLLGLNKILVYLDAKPLCAVVTVYCALLYSIL